MDTGSADGNIQDSVFADAVETDSGSSSFDSGSDSDAGSTDIGTTDSGTTDTGSLDAGTFDAASSDAGTADAASFDTSSPDTGSADTGSADTGPADTGLADTLVDTGSDAKADTTPVDPCSPLPTGLTTWTKTDTASTGTPDTYFFDVNPGDPFCATITGSGGTWSVNVSNGTSSGLYCSGSSKCSIVVPTGQLTLLVTAITTDIGSYTLTVRYRPR